MGQMWLYRRDTPRYVQETVLRCPVMPIRHLRTVLRSWVVPTGGELHIGVSPSVEQKPGIWVVVPERKPLRDIDISAVSGFAHVATIDIPAEPGALRLNNVQWDVFDN